MKYVRRMSVSLLGLLISTAASAQVVVHRIGDLPGGPSNSIVRDATKHNGVIYAVGGSAANPQTVCVMPGNPVGCVGQFNPDTAVLWTWDGTTGTLTALPNLQTNTTGTNPIVGGAITPDAAYIASLARSAATGPDALAVRVTANSLTNLNLNAAPFPVLAPTTQAMAISDDGSVLYGLQSTGGVVRAVRFDVTGSTSSLIPLLPGMTNNVTTFGGTTTTGALAIGVSYTTPYTATTNGRAFIYSHPGSTLGLPLLPGGNWSKPLAISPDGERILLAGDSSSSSNGEIYGFNLTSGNVMSFGSPQSRWWPTDQGGVTSDGSVIVVSYSTPLTGASQRRIGYVHNEHGWFTLMAALRAAGYEPWEDELEQFAVTGISPDGTLVWGSARGFDNDEHGFVAEFPAGFLESFNPVATPPSNQAIVGAWALPDPTEPELLSTFVLMANGSFYQFESGWDESDNKNFLNGFERGVYTYDNAGLLTFYVRQDNNGAGGLTEVDGMVFATSITGNSMTAVPVMGCEPIEDCTSTLTRVIGFGGSTYGAWVVGDARVDDDSAVLVRFSDNSFLVGVDDHENPSAPDGIEFGTGTWNPSTRLFTVHSIDIDTNGDEGLSSVGEVMLTLSNNRLSMILGTPPDTETLTRVGGFMPPTLTVNGSANPISIAPGATITVNVDSGMGHAGDWVGLAATSAPNGTFVQWKYLNNQQARPASGLTFGTVTFTAPQGGGPYEVRLFDNDSLSLRAESAAINLDLPTLVVNGITPPPATVACGSLITVTLTNGPGQAGDWIALAASGQPLGTFSAWNYLNNSQVRPNAGLTTATVTFTAPCTLGTHEIRLFTNDSLTLVTSVSFTVAFTTLTINGSSNPITVAGGTTLTVGIVNGPGNAGDWVALARPSDPLGTHFAWKYLNNSQARPGSGLTSANVTFDLNTVVPITLEVRLFRNDTATQIATSAAITALQPQLALNSNAHGTPISVAPGATISVGVTFGPGRAGDWLSLAATGSAMGSYNAWKYLNNQHTRPGAGLTTATVTFTAPLTPGTYELRFFHNDTLSLGSESAVITVANPTLQLNGTSNPITVSAGATITVTLSNGHGGAGDWLALAAQGAPASTYHQWKYLNNGTTRPVNGLTSATVTFTAPAAGTYEVRLFRDDSLLLSVTSAAITVQ